MGAVYFTSPCFPPWAQSKLINIFLAMLFYSKDRKQFGNRKTLLPLIRQINDLNSNPVCTTEEGVDIYVHCCLLTADNLGLHEIGGFVESFRAIHPCSVCKITRNALLSATREKPALLRNKTNYLQDVQKNNVNVTGINAECVLNEISDFHVLENTSLDIMHDLAEGVCPYDISKMLLHYIDNSQLFTIDDLNDRIGGFDYGVSGASTRIPFLKIEKLRKNSLGFSASESLLFVRFISFIVGDFVPEGDPHWELIICLKKIVDILHARSIDLEEILFVENLISEHHRIYISLFGNTLKPKHHNMLHYGRLLRRFGPLVNMWCMRFEAKHKEFKIYSHIITSRKNLPMTLSIKQQLKTNHRLMMKIAFSDDVRFGRTVSNERLFSHVEFRHFEKLLPRRFETILTLEYRGNVFRSGISVDIDASEIFPIFGLITFVCIQENDECFFIVNKLKTLSYSEHFHAFKVKGTKKYLNIPFNNIKNSNVTSVIILSADGTPFLPAVF